MTATSAARVIPEPDATGSTHSAIAPDMAFATEVVASFLQQLKQQCARLDPTLPVASTSSIHRRIDHFLGSEIGGFSTSLTAPAGAKAAKPRLRQVLMGRLRYFCKHGIPQGLQQALRRNRAAFELYRMLFVPHDSAVYARLTQFGTRVAPSLTERVKARLQRSRPPCDIQRLMLLDDDALRATAERLVAHDRERLTRALADAAAFNAQPSPQKALFVSAVFMTTFGPMLRALAARGWFTAWLGTRDLQDFQGYGSVGTHEIPAQATYPSSFLGTLVFMAAMQPQARILLNGESYYGANWNGEDALILYLLNHAIADTIRATRAPGSRNLFFLMYDGLKPVAKSGELKGELSKFYRGFMQSPDWIIYNSNLALFGEYVANAYGVTVPRCHFMRYSMQPKNPKPLLSFGPEGDTFHMACVTVCLNEFDEPSRDSGPAFVRSMIEQGIHFHYYCVPDSPAIARFRDSLKAEHRAFFHTHPVIKDQQALVDELCQYHAAFNPADHMPFAQGISQLGDRAYQDGMAAYWQSTVGTSFLVYAAAGLPSILPRGCTAAVELLADTAVPVHLSELANIRNHFVASGLRERRLALTSGSPVGWIDTHIDHLIHFIAQQ